MACVFESTDGRCSVTRDAQRTPPARVFCALCGSGRVRADRSVSGERRSDGVGCATELQRRLCRAARHHCSAHPLPARPRPVQGSWSAHVAFLFAVLCVCTCVCVCVHQCVRRIRVRVEAQSTLTTLLPPDTLAMHASAGWVEQMEVRGVLHDVRGVLDPAVLHAVSDIASAFSSDGTSSSSSSADRSASPHAAAAHDTTATPSAQGLCLRGQTHTHRQTHRHTDTHRQTHTHTHTDTHTHRHIHTHRQTHAHTRVFSNACRKRSTAGNEVSSHRAPTAAQCRV